MKHDVISVVEAAYELDLGTKGWLSLLLERAGPFLDRGLGLAATLWRLGEGAIESTIVTRRMDRAIRDALLAAGQAGSARAHQKATCGLVLGTDSQRLGLRAQESLPQDAAQMSEKYLYPHGVRDVLDLSYPDPSGLLVLIAAPMPDTRRPSRREAARWGRVATHIAAGARLRAAAAGGQAAECPEAILSPSGALHHAEGAAKGRAVREALREAARAMDRARAPGRHDADHALDLWRGLVAGRWSLVDRFDTDGRRYLVARKNDPEVRDPRQLTRRERQVLAYAAMGHPLKLIAYSLGLSVSTIALHRTRALRKLGLRSHADVVRLIAHESPN